MTPDEILAVLSGYKPLTVSAEHLTESAVLVPLRRLAGEHMDLVLIRRTESEGQHSGQVAFPGGRVEPGDRTPEDAALREANEELGIPRAAVEIVGALDEMLTITGFHVVPVVGLVDRTVPLVPSPREVARVFSVPMEVLLRVESWERRPHSYRGREVSVWHLPFSGEDIWGVTAHILRGMVERLWRVAGVDPSKRSR